MKNMATDWSGEISAPILEEIDGKPALQLPGDGLLLGDFSAALGELLRGAGVYARQGCAFTLDHQGQKLEPVTPEWLRTWIEKHVVPYKVVASKNQSGTFKAKKSISKDISNAVNVSPQFLAQLPKVERFNPCPMPTMRPSGTIELLPPGMDSQSATFTAEGGFAPEVIPVAEAVDRLRDLLAEFALPADGGRSLAVHVAAMLTVFAGGILPRGTVCPVFIYLANSEGAGKTLLAQCAGIPYADLPPAEAAPTKEEEWQKKLLALVASGRRLVLLDNLKGHLDSAALEAYVTSQSFNGRILGVTKEFCGDAGATILITGNRLTISPDMRRRSLLVELFMPELRAEDRRFKRILDAEAIRVIRPGIVSALWSIVCAWDKAGRKPCSHGNSSFPRWAETIAGMVEFAGFGSPLAPAEIEGMGDTDAADFSALVGLMEAGERYTFEQVDTMADAAGLFERILSDRDKEGALSRGAKSRMAKLLCRYDRRQVAAGAVFAVEGKGHSRRYVLHGQHGQHGGSAGNEKTNFSKGLKDHADHATMRENERVYSVAPPITPADESPTSGTKLSAPGEQDAAQDSPIPDVLSRAIPETATLADRWRTIVTKIAEIRPSKGYYFLHCQSLALEEGKLKAFFPKMHAGNFLRPHAIGLPELFAKLWREHYGQTIEFHVVSMEKQPPQYERDYRPPAMCLEDFLNDPGIEAAVNRLEESLNADN
jgi:hypothetical protein